MKAIIQSYTPKEIERIARGEQTVKVCKTAPKDTPFKVYMYCTKDRYLYRCRIDENRLAIPELWNGKVVGDYMCENVDKFSCKYIPRQGISLGYERFTKDGIFLLDNKDTDYVVFERQDRYFDTILKNADLVAMCLTLQELFDYAGGFSKTLRGLHISEPKIYDEPKELYEFVNYKKYQICKERNCFSGDCLICPQNAILTSPPKPWCYVEDVQYDN